MEWLARLDEQIERAPGFFHGRPVVLDLSVTQLKEPGIRALLSELQSRDIRIIGMEGADPSVQSLDVPGWPPMLNGGRAAGGIEVPDESPPPEPEPEETAALLISEPIRSGQSIVFPKGDVTIVGSVGSGAEVMAGGSIHVYGALRGRAIAGCTGNPRGPHLLPPAGSRAAGDRRPLPHRRGHRTRHCAAGRCRPGSMATRLRMAALD